MEDQGRISAINRFLTWVDLAERYVFPKPDSYIWLAGRLRIREGREKVDELEPWISAEKIRRNAEIYLKKRVLRASTEVDAGFFKRYTTACRLARSKVIQPLGPIGAAIYAYRELSDCFTRQPAKCEIRDQVDEWFRKGELSRINRRHWFKIFVVMAPLFDPGI